VFRETANTKPTKNESSSEEDDDEDEPLETITQEVDMIKYALGNKEDKADAQAKIIAIGINMTLMAAISVLSSYAVTFVVNGYNHFIKAKKCKQKRHVVETFHVFQPRQSASDEKEVPYNVEEEDDADDEDDF
jgi:hypothetical protein